MIDLSVRLAVIRVRQWAAVLGLGEVGPEDGLWGRDVGDDGELEEAQEDVESGRVVRRRGL